MNSSDRTALTKLVKEKALELGFDICGIARPRILSENLEVLKSWCSEGMNDEMGYLARNLRKRGDPGILFPGAKSLVVTGLSYNSEKMQKKPGVPIISRYTYGKNYHDAITGKLNTLLAFIKSNKPEVEGKAFVDSAPLLEKPWAKEAGLGWQGKHSIVINRKIGSFFFIGILILDIDLDYDNSETAEYCGDCRLCIDACPTGAINDNRTIDTRKCIANLTIEKRDPIPEEIGPKFEKRVFGCDKCQEVCPWNRNAKPNNHPEFKLSEQIAGMSQDEWLSLTQEQFEVLFKGSSVGRKKYEDLMRNIRLVMKY